MRRKDTKPISSYISAQLWTKVKKHTIEKDTTIAKFIARLIIDFFENDEKKTVKK
jgi:hypothetical protein